MRKATVKLPSFPLVPYNTPLDAEAGLRWQVLCGDPHQWRLGVYSPAKASLEEVEELEHHSCPELFLLVQGRLCLVMAIEGELRTVELEPERPVLVTAPHTGFCPDGPHTGRAVVVEQDEFSTTYESVNHWLVETHVDDD